MGSGASGSHGEQLVDKRCCEGGINPLHWRKIAVTPMADSDYIYNDNYYAVSIGIGRRPSRVSHRRYFQVCKKDNSTAKCSEYSLENGWTGQIYEGGSDGRLRYTCRRMPLRPHLFQLSFHFALLCLQTGNPQLQPFGPLYLLQPQAHKSCDMYIQSASYTHPYIASNFPGIKFPWIR